MITVGHRVRSVVLSAATRCIAALLLAAAVIWQSPPLQAQSREQSTQLAQVAFDSADEVWKQVFEAIDEPYRSPKLRIFDTKLETTYCGIAKSSNPPFYCAFAETIYLDPVFFAQLTKMMGTDSALALESVVAHEFGHHIQQILGDYQRFDDRIRQAKTKPEKNAVSVQRELQADCYSGIWAARGDAMDGEVSADDISDTLRAALVYGDDALQRDKGMHVDPSAFQHGSGTERAMWFLIGYNSPTIPACDTVGKG